MKQGQLDEFEEDGQDDPVRYEVDEYGTETNAPNLRVDLGNYLQAPPGKIFNLEDYGIQQDGGTVYRHSYHYHVAYPINAPGQQSETGVIELRSRIWLRKTEVPADLRQAVEHAAHRAAEVFDSSIETGDYSGYLTGFDIQAIEGSPVIRQDWEGPEPNAGPNAQVGKVDWNVEIMDHNDNLRGIAQGVANIWSLGKRDIPGREARHSTPHKWRIYKRDSDGRYQISPPSRTDAMARYRPGGAGAGKTVRINGKKVGSLGQRGRVFITPSYESGNDTHGDQYSRQGVINQTGATPQAFRDGGVLYMTGETRHEVHLSTAAEKPDGYRAAEADQVSPDLEIEPGAEPTTILELHPRSGAGEPTIIQGRRDEQITNALGYSSPPWAHRVTRRWEPA